MSRERLVHPTNEIAHLWAHKVKPEARNPQGNFYFNGDTIYSYGSHFPIARHVTNRHGQAAILFTTRERSNTTSRHLHDVRGAIPPGIPVFPVYNPESGTRWDNSLNGFVQEHRDNVADIRKHLAESINTVQRAKRYRALQSVIDKANEFNKFACSPVRYKLPINAAELEANAVDYEGKAEIRSQAARQAAETRRRNKTVEWRARDEAARVEREERTRQFRENLPAILEAWRNGEDQGGLLEWRYHGLDIPTMLRVSKNGKEVETSLGARFPIAHARLALRMVRRCRETGTEFHTNGHTIHLGYYKLDHIDAQGNVVAGCHKVAWDEVERIAPRLESTETEVSGQ